MQPGHNQKDLVLGAGREPGKAVVHLLYQRVQGVYGRLTGVNLDVMGHSRLDDGQSFAHRLAGI